MKLHYISLTLVIFLSTVAAQGLNSLPDCAKDCATGSIPKQCKTIDISCICGDKSFINNVSCCVANKCSKDQQDAVIKFATQICSGAGINDLPKSASCASGSSSATETSSGSSSTSNQSSTTATGTNTKTSHTTTSGSSSGSTSSTTSGSSGNSKTSTTSASSAATSAGGAAHVQGKDTSLLAAIGAAALALLA
ncbi:hypothetical protein BDV29DRAFT_37518 [Aspergillus leporis]|uniref:CFEM domain-containing protein n=1 Tax=Aspergillus leporis TaxID=41062 RepID=A0A5N5WP13_9EURO|nr:hypothetical protein BDV29DRAFT_37518 [Aspergillus leporis]